MPRASQPPPAFKRALVSNCSKQARRAVLIALRRDALVPDAWCSVRSWQAPLTLLSTQYPVLSVHSTQLLVHRWLVHCKSCPGPNTPRPMFPTRHCVLCTTHAALGFSFAADRSPPAAPPPAGRLSPARHGADTRNALRSMLHGRAGRRGIKDERLRLRQRSNSFRRGGRRGCSRSACLPEDLCRRYTRCCWPRPACRRR